MLRLSKKADYALMAMKHLAVRTDVASASAREIAEQYDIPIELMAKVLQQLARRGLLTSHQGTRGGYQLSKPTTAISVADIIQAIDGPLRAVRAVHEVQRARSTLAHQGPDRRGAVDLFARRDCVRRAERPKRRAVVVDPRHDASRRGKIEITESHVLRGHGGHGAIFVFFFSGGVVLCGSVPSEFGKT
ncbi:MAG: hypothetical protein DMF84_10120 [Acidobacteria bacterium]|nr:MAG: hypothetical protein DMF84_10120 [Acidobacteriota bacterium]